MSNNGLVVENLKIEKIAVGDDFSFDAVLARDLHMYLETQLSYEAWIFSVTQELKRARDYFEIYSDETNSSFYIFSVSATKKLLKLDTSDPAQKILKHLSSYDQDRNVLDFENTLLSDHDRYDVVKEFGKYTGCEDVPVPLSLESVVTVAGAIENVKLQVDQIQRRLERIDLNEITRIIK